MEEGTGKIKIYNSQRRRRRRRRRR